MNTRGQVIIGAVLVAVGILALLDRWLDIRLSALVFPLALIALGAWVISRPGRAEPGVRVSQQVFGDAVRRDVVADEDILVLLGDVKIDWRAVDWPAGAVKVHVTNVLGDTRVKVPQGVGVSIRSTALIGSLRLDERKQDAFLTSAELLSDDYETCASRLDLDVTHLLGDVRVNRGETA